MLEGLPAKALNHVGHTSWCAFRVVTVDKSCRSPLYLFQAVDFFIVVGVPDSGRVFKSWANHGSVYSCLHRGRAIAKVSTNKSKGFVGLVYSVVNVLLPGEISTDGNTQVLAAVNYFQCVSMDLIFGIDYFFCALLGQDIG